MKLADVEIKLREMRESHGNMDVLIRIARPDTIQIGLSLREIVVGTMPDAKGEYVKVCLLNDSVSAEN